MLNFLHVRKRRLAIIEPEDEDLVSRNYRLFVDLYWYSELLIAKLILPQVADCSDCNPFSMPSQVR
jgi:hypothetical protein